MLRTRKKTLFSTYNPQLLSKSQTKLAYSEMGASKGHTITYMTQIRALEADVVGRRVEPKNQPLGWGIILE
jgi:hypothetical protein